jgi:hypothetical protein
MEPLQLTYSVTYNVGTGPLTYYAQCGFCSWTMPYPTYGEASNMAHLHWKKCHGTDQKDVEKFEVET